MSNFLKVGEGLSFLKLSAAPASPVEGMVYYDETLSKLRYYDGTSWIDISEGDVASVNGQTGVVVLALDDIDNVDAAAPSDGQVLTYNNVSGNWEAETPAASGANTALSNLASTAVNTDILPSVDSTHDLGSSTLNWDNTWTKLVRSNGQLDLIAESADIQLSNLVSGDIRLAPQGQVDVLAPIDMNGFKVTALGNPIIGTDAANKDYVDEQVKNYITNSSFEGDANGVTPATWATYNDGASSVPTNGTGGTPTVNFYGNNFAVLRGTQNAAWQKGGTACLGQGFSTDFTIDFADKAKVLTISFDYIAGDAYVDGDMRCYIYDVTNAVLIETTVRDIPAGGSRTATPIGAKYLAQFQTSSNSVSYRLIIHQANNNTNSYNFVIDNVSVGPSVNATGAVMSDWISFTPTGSWVTNSTYTGKYRRVGDSLEMTAKVILSGAPTSAALTFNLPSGLTIDTAKLDTPSIYKNSLGTSQLWDNSTSLAHSAQVAYSTTTSVAVIYQGELTGQQLLVTQAQPFTFAASDQAEIRFIVPIQGWSSNVKISSDYGNRVISVQATKTSGTQTASGSYQEVGSWTENSDTTASFDPTTGYLTIPETGFYNLSVQLAFATNATGSRAVQLLKNGVVIANSANLAASATSDIQAQTETISFCNAGDVIKIGARQDSGGNLNYSTATGFTVFSAFKIQSPQTLAGGEVVAFRGTNTAGTTVTSGGITVPFTTTRDTHGAWNGSTYTVPVSGWYQVNYGLISAPVNLSTTQGFDSGIFIDGVQASYDLTFGNATNKLQLTSGAAANYYAAGTLITLRSAISTNTALNTTAAYNILSITKVG